MTDLKNKNALITGAGKGIGKAIAIALAKEGVNVILVSRTQADVDQLAAETTALGVKSLALSADVSDINSINSAVEKAFAEFKTHRHFNQQRRNRCFWQFHDIGTN